MVDTRNETRELFDRGVNFVMYKPISAERAAESLQAAWSLLPARAAQERTNSCFNPGFHYLRYTEDAPAPLLNLSEDGIAIHSESKMPPPCRVYFQFTLPGQPAVVRLAAEVIWQDWRGRVGLHFAHVPQTSRRLLDEWLRKNPNRSLEKSKPTPPRLERFVLASPESRTRRRLPPQFHPKMSAALKRGAPAAWGECLPAGGQRSATLHPDRRERRRLLHRNYCARAGRHQAGD